MKEYTNEGMYSLDDYHKTSKSMSKEDAKQVLKSVKEGYEPKYNFTGTQEDFDNYKIHIAMEKLGCSIDKN